MASRKTDDQPAQLYQFSRTRTLPMAPSNDCVQALRALGEDTRVRIVELLIDNTLDVGEISKRLAVSQYNVSKHLRILRESGLLEVSKRGRQRLYALPDAIRRRAAEGHVLDLGCCSFQFEAAGAGATAKKSRSSRRRTIDHSARLAR